MLKILAIFVMVGAIVTEAMPQKQVGSQSAASQHQQRANKPPDPSVAPITNNQASTYYQQVSVDKPQGWRKLVAWPEGITTWAVMLTLGAIVWQAIATKKSAEAALMQANHIVASERAWIKVTPHIESLKFFPLREDSAPIPNDLVEILPIAHQFPAKLVNVGKTPAKIEASAIRYIRTAKHPSKWDELPDYGELSKFEMYAFPDDILTITGQLSPIATMTQAQIDAVENGREFLFAYGIVKYSDVYGHKHETRFGYVYETKVQHLVMVDRVLHTLRTGNARFHLGGPPKYNAHS